MMSQCAVAGAHLETRTLALLKKLQSTERMPTIKLRTRRDRGVGQPMLGQRGACLAA